MRGGAYASAEQWAAGREPRRQSPRQDLEPVFLGVLRIVLSFQLPRGTPGKGLSFASGVVALVLAFIAISGLPNVTPWLIGTFIGVSLIFAGVARITVARGLRRAENVLTPAHVGAHA